MKGQETSCLRCNTSFIKKRENHKFCRGGCRTIYNRKKNGIAEPKFLKQGINKPTQGRPTQLMDSSTIEIKTPATELLMVQQQINYYEGIISDAGANVFPLYMVSLAGGGAIAGKNSTEKLAFSILGGMIGRHFDAQRKERIIKTAKDNIKLLKQQKKSIQFAEIVAKNSIQIGVAEVKRKGVLKVVNTDKYKDVNIPSLGLNKNTQWHYLMGDPSVNFMAMLHGLPGNGKSTFSIQFADYFQRNHGDVLYIASEQKGYNKSFQDLLHQYNVGSNFDIANDSKDHNYKKILAAAKEYKLVIIDSINHIGLTSEQFEDIREKSPKTAFLAIMQSAKDGNFKGSQEWAHNCDIIIEMRKMVAHQTKSRFSQPAHISVLR